MKIKVDTKNDTIYFRLDERKIIESEEVAKGIILDYDEKDNVIGIEILNVSKRIPIDKLKKMEFETM